MKKNESKSGEKAEPKKKKVATEATITDKPPKSKKPINKGKLIGVIIAVVLIVIVAGAVIRR